MNLSSLVIDTKEAWVEYPGLDGFKVNVTALGRKELGALHKRCSSSVFDRKTKQPIEKLDEEKFGREFTKIAVKGWEGLKLKYLEELMLVDLKGKNPEALLEYTEDNAITLVTSSTDFDRWLTDVVMDLENFRTAPEAGDVGSTGKVV